MKILSQESVMNFYMTDQVEALKYFPQPLRVFKINSDVLFIWSGFGQWAGPRTFQRAINYVAIKNQWKSM